jgi:tetratricopeptide (TPR) repeat protein
VERKPQADEALLSFIRNHPQSPRLGDARIALAELYTMQSQEAGSPFGARNASTLLEKAGGLLRVVAENPQSPQTAMQARYLAVFLADAQQPRQDEEVLRLGDEFLLEYSGSKLASEVRMKMGEVYLRLGDRANAEVQFASVAAQDREGPLGETALFLAGQCASSLLNPGSVDRALAYWDKVAGGKGPLRWKARYQQAAVKSRLGEEKEGAVLFELLIRASSGVSGELRLAARCGRADALSSLAKRTGESLDEAVAEYRMLLEDPDVTPMWRNQALYKLGKIFEKTDTAVALEHFESVLNSPGNVEAGEFFWSFKAGFDAAGLYQSKREWKQAVRVYEKLASMPGPRSSEARTRALQLRLEHFMWE